MIAKLFRPLPYPSVLLFAIIAGALGVIRLRTASAIEFAPMRWAMVALGVGLTAASFYLIVSFVRGLRLDLSLKRDGVTTYARISRIEEKSGGKGHPRKWWLIHYAFHDESGKVHEGKVEEPARSGTAKWKVGDSAPIRYHPEEPSIFRWLG